jgi:hypothetical protein
MKDFLICIKEQPSFKPGDLINSNIFYNFINIMLENANYEIYYQEQQIKLKAFESGLDIINDFNGLSIWPADQDLIWFEYNDFSSSFLTPEEHTQMLADYRQKQIDSILMDDFDSLFNK